MRIRCAHNLERTFGDIFRPPKIWVGVGPSPGFAVLPFVVVGQARKAVANKKAAEVAAIKFGRWTYRGTAEGDHGVFTDNSNGTVYAGSIAGGFACVGVATWTDGTTHFVECDADGKEHGRVLGCYAAGDTWYYRFEHGSRKEHAVLSADGTCEYNGEACRADYAPFVALQAMVVPIKARLPLVPPTAACMPHFSPPPPPNRSIGHCFGTRRSWRQPTPTWCALLRLRHQPAWALWQINLPNKCTARPTWTTHRRKDAPRVRHDRMRSAPFRRLCTRSEPPCASALPITCRTPSGSVAACGGLHV
jgi:hypothetical protein